MVDEVVHRQAGVELPCQAPARRRRPLLNEVIRLLEEPIVTLQSLCNGPLTLSKLTTLSDVRPHQRGV
jgi:hypothetical protein